MGTRKATLAEKRLPNPAYFKKLRRWAGLTRREAAKLANRSVPQLDGLEAGTRNTTVATFRNFLLVYKSGPFEILTALNMNPFDLEVCRLFRNRCRKERRDPVKVIETLMQCYVGRLAGRE